MQSYDFLLETRLKKLNSELAYRHNCCMGLFEMMLKKFLATFPTFTDHTLLHTLSVTNITNQLLREDVEKLSASEIYIYLMSSALHDIGMGVSDRDIEPFIKTAGKHSTRNIIAQYLQVTAADFLRQRHFVLFALHIVIWLLFVILCIRL